MESSHSAKNIKALLRNLKANLNSGCEISPANIIEALDHWEKMPSSACFEAFV